MEEWRDIKGYEGLYKVSSLGKIKSLGRYKRVLIVKPNANGYLRLRLTKKGKVKNLNSHRLVAEAFIPNPKNLPFVCHKDDNPCNNKASNLFWGTPQDNMDDKVNKNRQSRVKGILHGEAKLTEEDVLQIRLRINSGELYKTIADTYSIDKTTVSNIKTRKTWNHI